MTKLIYYEQPLNERVRTFLRLEHLFNQAAYTLNGFSIWDSRATLASLLEILDVIGRSDFKTEILKELDKHKNALARWQGLENVDQSQLDKLLNNLQFSEQQLLQLDGQVGRLLRDNEFISTIRQRINMPGGTCNFDLPQYHFWLQQPPEDRITTLEAWFNSLSVIRQPILLMLDMLRNSTDPEQHVAPDGFYQQNLDRQTPFQLIRVGIDPAQDCFAEISAGKHRMTIRFLQPQPNGRPAQVSHGVQFELICCAV